MNDLLTESFKEKRVYDNEYINQIFNENIDKMSAKDVSKLFSLLDKKKCYSYEVSDTTVQKITDILIKYNQPFQDNVFSSFILGFKNNSIDNMNTRLFYNELGKCFGKSSEYSPTSVDIIRYFVGISQFKLIYEEEILILEKILESMRNFDGNLKSMELKQIADSSLKLISRSHLSVCRKILSELAAIVERSPDLSSFALAKLFINIKNFLSHNNLSIVLINKVHESTLHNIFFTTNEYYQIITSLSFYYMRNSKMNESQNNIENMLAAVYENLLKSKATQTNKSQEYTYFEPHQLHSLLQSYLNMMSVSISPFHIHVDTLLQYIEEYKVNTNNSNPKRTTTTTNMDNAMVRKMVLCLYELYSLKREYFGRDMPKYLNILLTYLADSNCQRSLFILPFFQFATLDSQSSTESIQIFGKVLELYKNVVQMELEDVNFSLANVYSKEDIMSVFMSLYHLDSEYPSVLQYIDLFTRKVKRDKVILASNSPNYESLVQYSIDDVANIMSSLRQLNTENVEVRKLYGDVLIPLLHNQTSKIAESDYNIQHLVECMSGMRLMHSKHIVTQQLLAYFIPLFNNCGGKILNPRDACNIIRIFRFMSTSDANVPSMIDAIQEKIIPQSLSRICWIDYKILMNSLQNLDSNYVEVRRLLAKINELFTHSPNQINIWKADPRFPRIDSSIGMVLMAFKSMSDSHEEVRQLLRNVHNQYKHETSLNNPESISNAFYSLQHMKAECDETLDILDLITTFLEGCNVPFTPLQVSKLLYGLNSVVTTSRSHIIHTNKSNENSCLLNNSDQNIVDNIYITTSLNNKRCLPYGKILDIISNTVNDFSPSDMSISLLPMLLQGMKNLRCDYYTQTNDMTSVILSKLNASLGSTKKVNNNLLSPIGFETCLTSLKGIKTYDTGIQALIDFIYAKFNSSKFDEIDNEALSACLNGLQNIPLHDTNKGLINHLAMRLRSPIHDPLTSRQLTESFAIFKNSHTTQLSDVIMDAFCVQLNKMTDSWDSRSLSTVLRSLSKQTCDSSQSKEFLKFFSQLFLKYSNVAPSAQEVTSSVYGLSTMGSVPCEESKILISTVSDWISQCQEPFTAEDLGIVFFSLHHMNTEIDEVKKLYSAISNNIELNGIGGEIDKSCLDIIFKATLPMNFKSKVVQRFWKSITPSILKYNGDVKGDEFCNYASIMKFKLDDAECVHEVYDFIFHRSKI
jgi:hypothetical protein